MKLVRESLNEEIIIKNRKILYVYTSSLEDFVDELHERQIPYTMIDDNTFRFKDVTTYNEAVNAAFSCFAEYIEKLQTYHIEK
jgi:hypothetical protein